MTVTRTSLPHPVLRAPEPVRAEQVDMAALERDLAAVVDGEVRFDHPGNGLTLREANAEPFRAA